MKTILAFVFAISFVSTYAQSNKEDVDLVQAIYGKEKKALVAEFIAINDDVKKSEFWKLYDAYETQRKTLGQKRIALLEKYAAAYQQLDEKTTDELVKENMRLQKDTDGLIATYYGKIKTSVGTTQAAQFFQLETYLLGATRMYILENIPFIGEMKTSAVKGSK